MVCTSHLPTRLRCSVLETDVDSRCLHWRHNQISEPSLGRLSSSRISWPLGWEGPATTTTAAMQLFGVSLLPLFFPTLYGAKTQKRALEGVSPNCSFTVLPTYPACFLCSASLDHSQLATAHVEDSRSLLRTPPTPTLLTDGTPHQVWKPLTLG